MGEEPKKVIPPPMKGTKNKGGDYVVTSIDIPDLRDGVKSKAAQMEEDDSDRDEGYDDEDDEPVKEEAVAQKEEVKTEKKLTKKEQKAKEDAEFEALMSGIKPEGESKEEEKAEEAPKAG